MFAILIAHYSARKYSIVMYNLFILSFDTGYFVLSGVVTSIIRSFFFILYVTYSLHIIFDSLSLFYSTFPVLTSRDLGSVFLLGP